jgi:hypothetical protein
MESKVTAPALLLRPLRGKRNWYEAVDKLLVAYVQTCAPDPSDKFTVSSTSILFVVRFRCRMRRACTMWTSSTCW